MSTPVDRLKRPDKVDLSLNAGALNGVTFFIDGVPRSGPFTITTLIGSRHTISVPPTITSGSNVYAFNSWSNGSVEATQSISVPGDGFHHATTAPRPTTRGGHQRTGTWLNRSPWPKR